MISVPSLDAKIPARFAQAPWTEHTDFWCQLDEQLPHDHLARQIRDAMAHLDLPPMLGRSQQLTGRRLKDLWVDSA